MSPLHIMWLLLLGALTGTLFVATPSPSSLAPEAPTPVETHTELLPEAPMEVPQLPTPASTTVGKETMFVPVVSPVPATTTPASSTPIKTVTSDSPTRLKKKDAVGRKSSSDGVTVTETLPTPKTQEPRYTLAPAGEDAELTLSSAKEANPKFISAVISPLHVYVGDTQTFMVKVQSDEPISQITSVTELDNETLTLILEETDSDSSGTTFSSSWVVRDTHVKTYRTTFTAENAAGEENSIVLAWSDPCAGITQGVSSTLSSNCTVSEVSGLDGGSLTIPSGVTLTLNSGTTWVWNPGTSVFVNGVIALNGTAQIKKGYLFYSGTNNDNANTSTFVFDTASTKSGHVRSGTWFMFNDQVDVTKNTLLESNTVTIRGIASGTTVTLTGGGTGESNIAMSINGGAWVTTGTINPGETLKVRLQSGPDPLTDYWVTVTVGGSSSIFSVTTKEVGGGGGGCDPLC